jgi:short subunit dehydrogenase-like uncharacterized protein
MSWMIYGANGYTGELIAREAVRRGLKPVLAGRSTTAITRLGAELGLETRHFPLEGAALTAGIAGMDLVLHCAGPFSATAAPMIDACLAARAHYLDITGEISVFEYARTRDADARAAGVVVCPGVGFDVVPTDCLALALYEAMPAATDLALGFDGRSGPSRGTARTMVEGIGQGGCVREHGKLRRVPLGFRDRRIDFGAGVKVAMTIPWGDVSTAYYTTGIGNIEAYVPIAPRRLRALRRLNLVRPLLRLGFVQRWLKARVDRQPPGPDEREREATPTAVWGEVRDASGRTLVARVQTANGYTVTVHGALGIVERLLGAPAGAGAWTPARLMGSRYVESLPGSSRIRIGPDAA